MGSGIGGVGGNRQHSRSIIGFFTGTMSLTVLVTDLSSDISDLELFSILSFHLSIAKETVVSTLAAFSDFSGAPVADLLGHRPQLGFSRPGAMLFSVSA